ncbi:MAG: hypothetical protein VXY77_00205 [Pseudomonadota bacterium]|nr:hypothetical protein [Pseudomonadota bacterium]
MFYKVPSHTTCELQLLAQELDKIIRKRKYKKFEKQAIFYSVGLYLTQYYHRLTNAIEHSSLLRLLDIFMRKPSKLRRLRKMFRSWHYLKAKTQEKSMKFSGHSHIVGNIATKLQQSIMNLCADCLPEDQTFKNQLWYRILGEVSKNSELKDCLSSSHGRHLLIRVLDHYEQYHMTLLPSLIQERLKQSLVKLREVVFVSEYTGKQGMQLSDTDIDTFRSINPQAKKQLQYIAKQTKCDTSLLSGKQAGLKQMLHAELAARSVKKKTLNQVTSSAKTRKPPEVMTARPSLGLSNLAKMFAITSSTVRALGEPLTFLNPRPKQLNTPLIISAYKSAAVSSLSFESRLRQHTGLPRPSLPFFKSSSDLECHHKSVQKANATHKIDANAFSLKQHSHYPSMFRGLNSHQCNQVDKNQSSPQLFAAQHSGTRDKHIMNRGQIRGG